MVDDNRKDIDDCRRCRDPLSIVAPENKVCDKTSNIAIFRCPECNGLVLDDSIGWKGSGVVFRATEEQIERYLEDGTVPTVHDGSE